MSETAAKCPRCFEAGEQKGKVFDCHTGEFIPCPDCHGTGEVKAKVKRHNGTTESNIVFLKDEIISLEKKLKEAKVKIIKENLFGIVFFNVEPYFDKAENEIRISNLSVTVEALYEYMKKEVSK